MSKKKEYTPLLEYDIFYVDIKPIMEAKGISQNILSKITDLSINTIRSCVEDQVYCDLSGDLCNCGYGLCKPYGQTNIFCNHSAHAFEGW